MSPTLDFLGRYVERRPIAFDMGDARLQFRQRSDRVRGAALGARFEKAPEQDQRDDDAGGFVIDIRRAGGQQRRREGGDDGIEVGAARAGRDQRIHVGRSARQSGESLGVEGAAGAGEQQARQDERNILHGVMADMRHDPFVHGGDHMTAHFQHDHRRGQHGGGDQPARQRSGFIRARVPLAGARDLGGLITGLGDGVAEILDGRRPLEHAHAGAFGREIDARRQDAGRRQQRFFDMGDARRAGHAAHAQLQRLNDGLIAGVGHRLRDLLHSRVRR